MLGGVRSAELSMSPSLRGSGLKSDGSVVESENVKSPSLRGSGLKYTGLRPSTAALYRLPLYEGVD